MNGSIQNFDWNFHLFPLMIHWFYLESIQGVSTLQYFEGILPRTLECSSGRTGKLLNDCNIGFQIRLKILGKYLRVGSSHAPFLKNP